MDKVTSSDGTLIAYERTGEGPALVLVHGATADHTRWAPVLPMLGDRFTVYALDRRGRGESGDSPAYSLEREYEDIAAVVSSISGPVNLLGHSYGALISLEAALLLTNLSKLILYEPPIRLDRPIYPPGIRSRLQALLDSGDREALLLLFLREVAKLPEDEIAMLRNAGAWEARLAAAHTVVRELAAEDYVLNPAKFRNSAVPTMLLRGEESPDTTREMIEALHGALPNSKIVVIPGQQHIAMRTAPEVFVSLVTEFLTEPA